MSPRARRLARGWVAAFVATTLAAGSHAAVDGSWPSPLIIALSMCLAAPLCMLLAGRVLSRWSVAGSVLLSQALLHTLYAQSGGMAHAIDHTHHHAAPTPQGAGENTHEPFVLNTTSAPAHAPDPGADG